MLLGMFNFHEVSTNYYSLIEAGMKVFRCFLQCVINGEDGIVSIILHVFAEKT